MRSTRTGFPPGCATANEERQPGKVGACEAREPVFRRLRDRPLSDGKREIFVEFVVHGNTVKATAIDSVSGIEASIVGPATAGREALTQAAIRKLEFVLKKKS